MDESVHSDIDVALRAIPLLDLTELGDDAVAADVERLCRRAAGPYGTVAAVCVWSRFVAQAADALEGTDVRVATVVNFPSGDESVDAVVAQTSRALESGADEIDVVLPYRALMRADEQAVRTMLGAVRQVVPERDRVVLKVILETGELVEHELITTAARLAVEHGADFLKTSTGKTAISATLDATNAMLAVIHGSGRHVGLKASGGIRTVAEARRYLDQADAVMGRSWVSPTTFRFGASALLDALEAAVAGAG